MKNTLRRMILKRDKHCCTSCGSKDKLQIHHVDGDRSNDVEDNLVTLCKLCHFSIHNHGVGGGYGESGGQVENEEIFTELWNNGYRYKRLAQYFKRSLSTVHEWAEKLGLSKVKHRNIRKTRGAVKVSINEKLEGEFRERAMQVKGYKKGSLKEAMEEAIREWLDKEKHKIAKMNQRARQGE